MIDRLEEAARRHGLSPPPSAEARVLDLDRDRPDGLYDYVIARGLASLPDVARHLAAGGVAVVTHDVAPRATLRGMVGELVDWCVRDAPSGPKLRNEILAWVVRVARNVSRLYDLTVLEAAADTAVTGDADGFLEAARRFQRHGLAFVADLEPPKGVPADLGPFLPPGQTGPLDREQTIDEITGRLRRQSLLRRSGEAQAPPAAPARTSFEYDDVAYPARVHPRTNPAQLELVGRLFGLDPRPAARARVLEIGCATGGNLLPMAERWPEASFVGIDLSGAQIDVARGLAAEASLTNVELHALDIHDLDEGYGTFDYIIAHGFYSWVPAAARDRLLAVCAGRLAPDGLAFISFDAKPGWSVKKMTREIMLHHLGGLAGAQARVDAARAHLMRIAAHNRDRDKLYAALISDVLQASEADMFFFHDDLGPFCDGFWLHEVAAHLDAHGLAYVGDADLPSMLPLGLPLDEVVGLDGWPTVEREQLLDILRNRHFREAVICRAGRARDSRPLTPASLASFSVAADQDAPLPMLARAWPAPLPVAQLDVPLEWVFAWFAARKVTLAPASPPLVTAASEKPRAGAFTRLLARRGAEVPSLLHENLILPDLDRRVLALLDGERDRAALRQASGVNAKALDRTLARLARLGLLLS